MIMKNTTKVGLGLLVTSIVGTSAVVANHVLTKEERTKSLIEEVWNEIKDDIMHDLELDEEPVLVYESLEHAVMQVRTRLVTKGGMFSQRIIETNAEYKIYIDIDAVIHTIAFYNQGALYMTKVDKMVIKQLLSHECRHIWQGEVGYQVGEHVESFSFSLKGHGESNVERDANEYALTMAKTPKEKALFLLQKRQQEVAGTFSFMCNTEELMEARKEFIKVFHPILSRLGILK
jgi:hypothetical protein